MENSEDAAWVFDSLVGFLHGPIWNAPLQTFIEEKSLSISIMKNASLPDDSIKIKMKYQIAVFEPTDSGQVSEREEYLAIHEEYKNLVDLMLGSYMEDIGISSDQFEMACQMSKDNIGGLPVHFHQRLFEQIWAANDYNMFIRMMTQRNIELQLQALELIEQRSGTTPNSFLPYDENEENAVEYNDAKIMEQVKKLSLEDPQYQEAEEVEVVPNIENLQEEKKSLKTALDDFQKRVTIKESIELPSIKKDDTEKSNPIANTSDSIVSQVKPMQEEIEQRQQYLKQQRDKLLTLKRQIREKQLNDSTESSRETVRPKSAKTAQLMLLGGMADASGQDSSLNLRKALAERLRSEVVEKL